MSQEGVYLHLHIEERTRKILSKGGSRALLRACVCACTRASLCHSVLDLGCALFLLCLEPDADIPHDIRRYLVVMMMDDLLCDCRNFEMLMLSLTFAGTSLARQWMTLAQTLRALISEC